MSDMRELFERNRAWAARLEREEPGFLADLARQQRPRYLWIGCADSRVMVSTVTGFRPGEIFVHRNIANLVIEDDLSCLSVIQYAVEALEVEHVIVCGHYQCGGVVAALDGGSHGGEVDRWLSHIRDLAARHQDRLAACEGLEGRIARLCELNVIEQARNVCHTTIVQEAWRRGKRLAVHGLIYGLEDGRLRDVGFHVTSAEAVEANYRKALDGRVGFSCVP